LLSLLLVGDLGGTNIGQSFRDAARAAGIAHQVCQPQDAFRAWKIVRSFFWRFLGRRPPRLNRFSASVVRACADFRPDVLLATGIAPLTADALGAIGRMGVVRVNYLTDDPWSVNKRAGWFLRALPGYDVVFSPRTANLADLREAGCPDVHYLPFGYDPALSFPDLTPDPSAAPCDVLFVGGGDADRAPYLLALQAAGFNVAICGSYWEPYRALRPCLRGQVSPEAVRRATSNARLCLCLARRANRDGHVMRSFEIPASRGCMLAEDTAEHRALFGDDGDSVCYFQGIPDMVDRIRRLLADDAQRRRLADAAYQRIVRDGKHTYGDRLSAMLAAVAPTRRDVAHA
jgi:hypothetical protein